MVKKKHAKKTENRNGKSSEKERGREIESRTEEKLRSGEREKESVQRKSTCRLKGSCMQHRTRSGRGLQEKKFDYLREENCN